MLPAEIAKDWIYSPDQGAQDSSIFWSHASLPSINLIYCVQRWSMDDTLHHVMPGEFIIFNWSGIEYTIASTDPREVVADFVAKLLTGDWN